MTLSPFPPGPSFQLTLPFSLCLNISTFETIFLWVSITPFGFPVVPDEYIKKQVSVCGSCRTAYSNDWVLGTT